MKKVIILIFMCVFYVGFSQNLSDKIPTDKDVRIGVLDNGLKYYIKHNGYPENKVELRLGINAGSVLETDAQQGLAHFMEHMNFNGTKSFPKNKLIDYLQSLGIEFGADLNAYTSFDETVYMLPVPLDKKGNLDTGLLVLEDWAFNALLETEDIDDERGVILEEKRLRDGASSRMLEKWLPIAYKDSRYAERLPIGTEEVLKTFPPDEIRKFKNDWYRPNLMTVVVVGDIDVDEIESKIKKNFSKYKNPKHEKKRVYYDIPNYTSPNIAIASDSEAPSTSAQISYFNPKPAQAMVTVGDYKTNLTNSLFSQMLNMRYSELANSDEPPFNYAFSYYGGTFSDRKKAFTSVVSSTPEKIGAAFDAMLLENQRVKLHGFVASELERAKAELLSRIEKQYNNQDKIESRNWVGQYLRNYLEDEPIPSLKWEYDAYQKLLPMIQLKDVNALIDTFIQENNFSVVITGPKQSLEENQVAGIINNAKVAQLDPYEDSTSGLALMTDLPKPGKIVKSENNEKMETTTLTLSNGIKVVYKKTEFKNDEIVFRAYSYGGYSLMTDDEYNRTHFAMGGLKEAGINGLSNSDIDKLMSGKNVSVNPFVSNLSEGMSGNSTQKDLETMFQMIHLYFTSLNYNENAFSSYQQKQEGMYGSLINNPEYFFYNEFNKYSNQNNPRNPNIFPLKEDWEVLDYKLAYDKYKERFANPADFTFYFVGSIENSSFENLVRQYLASLPTTKNFENYKEVSIQPLKGLNEKIIKRGSDTKSTVIMDFSSRAPYNKKDEMAMKMLGDILSIKLIEVLREDEGGVYSVRANGGMSRGVNSAASLSAFIPTGVEQYEKMQELTLKEIAKIKKDGPTEVDLNKVKESLKNDYKENIQKNNFWLNTLYQADFYKEDASKVFQYEDFVSSFSVQDIKKVANQFVGDDLTIGILIPEEMKKEESKDVEVGGMTARQVVDLYATSVTGMRATQKAIEKLKNVKSIYRKGTVNFAGMEVSGSLTLEAPATEIMEMDMTAMGQGKMKFVSSPDGNYMEMGGQKQELPADENLSNQKGIFDLVFSTDEEISLEKAVEVEGTKMFVIYDKRSKENYYINANTGLIEKTIHSESNEPKVFSDYQIIDGFKIPMNVKIQSQGQSIESKFTTASVK